MTIREAAKSCHENSKAKGFYEGELNVGEKLMLIVSEASEALEADRNGLRADVNGFLNSVSQDSFKEHIKDSFEDELADIVIRVFDLAEAKGIDIEFHIAMKMAYNSKRPHKHGKAY